MDIKAICTDIDGTLLNKERELSTETLDAIAKISDRIPIILASSRMPAAMRYLQKELNIESAPLICYNGGYVINYTNTGAINVLDSKPISIDVCEKVVDVVRHTSLHLSLYSEDNWYAPRMDKWTEREMNNTKVTPTIFSNDEVIALWKTQNNPGAHKIMCMGDEKEIAMVNKQLSNAYQNELHLYLSKSTYLEIASNKTSKAIALHILLKALYNFNESQVMAFGDNYNDIDMLKAAGLGIAVGNARQEVKDIAKEITLKSIDDGVAFAIRKYFELR